MKKTKLMRAALLLLVLTLITSCFVGGTFAKYVTKGDSTDIAHVAKWGVKIDAKGGTFAEEYATDTGNVANKITKSVKSTKNVVAPGTRGKMEAVEISGIPEVAVNVSYKATFDVSGWKIGDTSKFYCPLQIKVGKITIDGTGFDDETAFKDAVNAEISKYNTSTNYAAGTDLRTASVTAPSISWEWPFEPSATEAINPQTNENDTKLGNLETAPTVSLEVTTTVTQID